MSFTRREAGTLVLGVTLMVLGGIMLTIWPTKSALSAPDPSQTESVSQPVRIPVAQHSEMSGVKSGITKNTELPISKKILKSASTFFRGMVSSVFTAVGNLLNVFSKWTTPFRKAVVVPMASKTIEPLAENVTEAKATSSSTSSNSGTIRQVTAYNSVEWQADETPCIAADGTDICERHRAGERICASNAFPFGTRLALHGDEKTITCVVADRMNSRYPNRVDLFMDKDVDAAISFGIQELYVERQ